MEMETIDALSFDKEMSYDRVVGCTFKDYKGEIWDLNHSLIRSPVSVIDNKLTISLDIKNGIDNLISFATQKMRMRDKDNELEIAMSNDQLSLCFFNFKCISQTSIGIHDGTIDLTFDIGRFTTTVQSNYSETEYVKKRD